MFYYKMNQNYFKLGFVSTTTNLFLNKIQKNKTKKNTNQWLAKINEPIFNFKDENRRKVFQILAAGSTLLTPFLSAQAKEKKSKKWEQIEIPVDTVLFDLDFVKDDPQHGWLVGSKGTFLETTDAGKTWIPRTFANLDPDEELTYRFENISFFQNDGWVIGKPAILLHTKDGGKSWLRVPVSPKLPGEPILITALGPDTAEMATSAGAIYVTTNGGRNWKAQVKETIDSTLNRTISSGVSGASYFTGNIIGVIRDKNGKYLAISSRGNFFLTWQPGQEFWIPRARDTSRRIQSMGFFENDLEKGLWMSTRGGGLSFTNSQPDFDSVNNFDFSSSDIKTGGYGILDVNFKNKEELWAACGGGILYSSFDGGKSWKKDDEDKIVGSLYKIKFFNSKSGFVLGSNGVLLRYID
mmetsp:Transcript_18823/g.47478  ORF Transcript_18823/g.47478 Transcript_18823/m.47478 type:complete len:410 (-) Transcript_18823:205-1434(-)